MDENFLTKLLFFLTAIFAFIAEPRAQSTVQGSFNHGGLSRSYRIYIPASYNSLVPVPLVLNLHGYTSNNVQQESYGDFRPIADTANFIIVHPNGTVDNSGYQHWNCFGISTVDDVGFLSALIDTVAASYAIDENRIYSTGMSNGGIMSYHLACALSGRIAAVASVTGSMSPAQKNACNAQHPTPIMEIHGTADGTVPYNGSASFLPIDSVVKFWSGYNNCSASPSVTTVPDNNAFDGSTAERYLFSACDMDTDVELYKVIGGGHTWPGATVNIGVTNKDFSASAEIWRFFSKYRLNLLTGKSEISELQKFSIFPNPCKNFFNIKMNSGKPMQKIMIFNTLGSSVPFSVSISGDLATVNISALPKGLYLISILQDDKFQIEKFFRN